jgi:hypothetical protein
VHVMSAHSTTSAVRRPNLREYHAQRLLDLIMSVAFEVDETVVVELELKLECVLLCRELGVQIRHCTRYVAENSRPHPIAVGLVAAVLAVTEQVSALVRPVVAREQDRRSSLDLWDC